MENNEAERRTGGINCNFKKGVVGEGFTTKVTLEQRDLRKSGSEPA